MTTSGDTTPGATGDTTPVEESTDELPPEPAEAEPPDAEPSAAGPSGPRPEAEPSGRRLYAFLLAVGLFLVGYALMRSTGRDDAFITYWPARSLAETGQILNPNGVRYEESTTLLLTVLLAGLKESLPLSIPILAWWASALSGIASLYLAGSLAELLRPGTRLFAVLVSGLLLPLTYWALSGMEMTLVAVLITATLLLALRPRTGAWLKPGVYYPATLIGSVLIAMVRPDAPLYWLAAWVGVLVVTLVGPHLSLVTKHVPATAEQWRETRRLAVLFAGTGALAIALVAAWRLWYFGVLLPAPVTAKVGGLKIAVGFYYLVHTLGRVPGLALLGAVALVAPVLLRRAPVRLWLPTWSLGTVYLLGVVAAGGDWMELGRLFVPIIPVLAALAVVILARVRFQPVLRVVLAAALALSMFQGITVASNGSPLGARLTSAMPEAWSHEWRYPFPVRDSLLHFRDARMSQAMRYVVTTIDRVKGSVTIDSVQGGEVPFYAYHDVPNLTLIDRTGLVTDQLRACALKYGRPGSDFGSILPLPTMFRVGWDTCGLKPPDVIYDPGSFPLKVGKFTSDYCLFRQFQGRVRHDGGWFTGIPLAGQQLTSHSISNHQFIAVEVSLYPLVSSQPCRS